MSEPQNAEVTPPDPILPLQIPASHLNVIFAGLGELPAKYSAATIILLRGQIDRLALAAAEHLKQQEAKKTAEQTKQVLTPVTPDKPKSTRRTRRLS